MFLWLLIVLLLIAAVYGGVAINPLLFLVIVIALLAFYGGPGVGRYRGRGWW